MRPNTELYALEGRENLRRTMEIVAEAIDLFGVEIVITFTALGDGALQLHSAIEGSKTRIVAVTFPAETTATDGSQRIELGIPDIGRRRNLEAAGVTIVQAALPFNGFNALSASSTANVVQQTLSMFGGGLSLCVQAVLMACDAGRVRTGERCIAFAADTAIVARAAHTQSFLSKQSSFAIEHILCKPLEYQVTRAGLAPKEQKQAHPRQIEAPAALHNVDSPTEPAQALPEEPRPPAQA